MANLSVYAVGFQHDIMGHIVVVLSPFVNLNKDQVEHLQK